MNWFLIFITSFAIGNSLMVNQEQKTQIADLNKRISTLEQTK